MNELIMNQLFWDYKNWNKTRQDGSPLQFFLI